MGKLAVSPPFKGCTLAETLEICREAQDWGYTSAWGSEVNEQDPFVVLAALAMQTDYDLGVAVVPVQTRSVFVLARAALTLAELTGGRFSLGIGASSEVVVTRFAGQPWHKPLTYLREAALALKPMLAGERATFDGEFVKVSGFKYPAEAPTPVPLVLGSLNPKSLQLAGELADGVSLNQMAPEHVPTMMAEVRKGAEAAGRDLPADYPVVARLMTIATDDPDGTLAFLKTVFAPYAATTGYNRFYRWIGYEAEADGIAKAAAAGDKAAMVAAYSDAMARDVLIVGTDDQVAQRVAEYLDAGVTIAAIEPLGGNPEDVRRTMRAAARALA